MVVARARKVLMMVTVVCGCSAAVGAVAPAAGTTSVKGRSFKTKAPTGWTVTSERFPKSARSHVLISAGRADEVSIPPQGEVAITIFEINVKQLGLKHPSKATAGKILEAIVGTPKAATDERVEASGTIRLNGVRAATVTFTYTYEGRQIRQRDTAARRGKYAVLIETNSDISSDAAANSARKTVQGSWRWR